MKLARDSWLLVVVPASVLLGGAWWVIASNGAPDPDAGAVRFELAVPHEVAPPAGRCTRSMPLTRLTEARGVAIPESRASLEPVDPAKSSEPTPWGIWSGRIVTRDGVPIEGASVVIHATRNMKLGDDTTLGESETITATIGKNGELVFEMKPGFRYEVEVRAQGYGLEKYEIQGQMGHDLVLDRASAVDGRVLAQGTREPLAGAKVTFQNGNESYTTRTDADGRFSFDGVGARPAHVTVTDNRYIARTQAIESLAPGGSVSFNLDLQPGSPLRGEVLSDGSLLPIGNMEVSLVDRLTHEVVANGYTDALGRFSFSALVPLREYYVSIAGFGFRTDRPAQVGRPGDSLTFTVAQTWTLGLQLSLESGAAAGVNVILRRQDGLPHASGVSSYAAVSNGQGFVAFGNLSRDLAYRVVIQQPGMATMELGPVVSAGGGDQMIPVGLMPARALFGHVIDTAGQPVPFATVRAQRVDGFPAPPLFVQADASGGFMFDCLAPGTISLVTFRAGYDNTREIVDIPADGPPPVIDLTMPALQSNSSPYGNLLGQ